ncbi:MAG: hypothetical protein KF819_26235 [Labilithrix sp.]|nr:hypothetical protein [Labilithrix sp.]
MRLSRHWAWPLLLTVIAAACGGKIDASSRSSGGASVTPQPTTTSVPTSVPPSSPSVSIAEQLGASVAKRYCAIFDKCCQAKGMTPIDFASCLQYTEARVRDHAVTYLRAQQVTDAEIERCASAIEARLSRCSTSDAKWWLPGGSLTTTLFVPTSVASACSFLDLPKRPLDAECSDLTPCTSGTCAIDECVPAAAAGEACTGTRPASCLDGDACDGAVCALAPRSPDRCTEDDECALGHVCQGTCTPVKKAPRGHYERHSPYRVSLETCQIFVNL